MNSNRNLDRVTTSHLSEVLMEYLISPVGYDGSDKIEVWLDEKHYLERSDYKSGTVISHGFYSMRKLFRTFLCVANLFIST